LLTNRQLQKENEELKQLVTEHRSVLEKIMQKYRQHIQQLQLMEEKEKIAVHLFNAGLAQVNHALVIQIRTN
jgi:cell division septum initiation protein DivIVA